MHEKDVFAEISKILAKYTYLKITLSSFFAALLFMLDSYVIILMS